MRIGVLFPRRQTTCDITDFLKACRRSFHRLETPLKGHFCFVLAACSLVPAVTFGASLKQRFALAASKKNVDFEASKAFYNNEPQNVRKRRLLRTLGLVRVTRRSQGWHNRWSAGKVGYQQAKKGNVHVFDYRVAFHEPVEIGSILFPTHKVRILKPDAPYPGDPSDETHWKEVSVPKKQGKLKLTPLPPGTQTRAVLFTDRRKRGKSIATPLRLYKRRLFNIAPFAKARAKKEYHVPKGGVYRASDVAQGRGEWRNNGENDNGFVTGPYISDVEPTWYALGWENEREIAGIFTCDNFRKVTFERFKGPASINPLIGVEDEWYNIKDRNISAHYKYGSSHYGRWVKFSSPLETRGLRFFIEGAWKKENRKRKRSQVARLSELIIFKDLGEEKPPSLEKETLKPPVSVAYETPQDGTVTMVVEDENGERIRNLFARNLREKGKHKAHWDLRDRSGNLVEPGEYQWKAINGPELKLEYEMSVYPNVSVHHPENTAWLNGSSGSGGWLADHSPPYGVGAGGGRVCFTCPVPEAGVGFAVTNSEGKKLWGINSFASWSGGKRVVCTGETAYVEQFRGGKDRIWGVDLETKKVSTVLQRHHSETRRRGITGLAHNNGKIYASVNADADWISNATSADSVIITKCLPRYKEKREPREKYEVVPDPRNDFLRLFRLKGTPPGYGEDHGLIRLESTRGPGMEQYIMVAFKKPVAVGSCIYPVPQNKDYEIRLNVLKEDAPFPPDPEKKELWKSFKTHGDDPWDVAIAPENTKTRALLIRFVKGGDDEVSRILRGESGNEKEEGGLSLEEDNSSASEELGLSDGSAWRGHLEGMQILRRRYKNLFESCHVRVSSGDVDQESGKWVAERSEPLTKQNPALYMMTWDEAVPLRGLAFKEIDAKKTKVDVWTGPSRQQYPLKGGDHWETVGTFTPGRRTQHTGFESHNALARYYNGRVDFGKTMQTPAVRLRCVSQWKTETREGSCAKGQKPLDPTRCRVFGVAPVKYIGGEKPVDPRFTERIEVINPNVSERDETVTKEISIDQPRTLTFNNNDDLLGFSGNDVVKVDRSGDGKHEKIITDLKQPTALTVDEKNQIYVFDRHPSRKVIRVYDEKGEFQRRIGKRGGFEPGPWDPLRFRNVSSMSIADDGKLWVVDSTRWPKRCAAFTTEGDHIREYLGPTRYGGGGVLDPYDKTRLVYGRLEFEIDWDTGKSHLKNLLMTRGGWPAGEIHIKYDGHDYYTNQPGGASGTMPVAVVYKYVEDHLEPVAAMGWASEFAPLSKPVFQEKTGDKLLKNMEFTWRDKNRNTRVDPEEVTFRPKTIGAFTRFNRDMGIQAGNWRFELQRIEEGGIPVYERVKTNLKPPKGAGVSQVYRLRDRSYYMMGNGYPDTGFNPDGSVAWTYENEGAGVGPNRHAPPYTPGQVLCQFGLAGHAVASKGDLGEFFVLRANLGTWYLWTSDGLLASRIFKDPRQKGDILWSMPENDRNMDLTDVSLKQEHFRGWFTRIKGTDEYYAVAGKPHASVVQVKGLNQFHRMSDTLEVTPQDIAETIEWQEKRARREAESRNLKYYHCYPVKDRIVPNGKLNEWKKQPRARMSKNISYAMAYDDENLYLAYKVKDLTELKNQGNRWDRLFKTGACVDVMLQTDPDVSAERKMPKKGDMRILFSRYQGEPRAVLYQPVAPDASEEDAWSVESPVTKVSFDKVRRLEEAKIGYRRYTKHKSEAFSHFVLEVAIPLDAIDLEIKPDLRLKMDWGYLQSDKRGTTVKARRYWANDATSTLADTPSEARLTPDLWGYVQFHERPRGAEKEADPMDLSEEEEEEEEMDVDVEGIDL